METETETEQKTPPKKNKKDNGRGGIRELKNKIKLKSLAFSSAGGRLGLSGLDTR